MIKISRPEAYSGMNELDFKVYEYETYLMEEWASNTNRRLKKQFYLEESKENIFLNFIDESDNVVYSVRFVNKNKSIMGC